MHTVLLRQRRNFISYSLLIIIYSWGGITLNKISLVIVSAEIDEIQNMEIIGAAIWVWFFIRYLTSIALYGKNDGIGAGASPKKHRDLATSDLGSRLIDLDMKFDSYTNAIEIIKDYENIETDLDYIISDIPHSKENSLDFFL